MDRRKVLGGMLAGSAIGTVASPAIGQSAPEIKWRLTSSFPKSLDTVYKAAEIFAEAVREITDGRFSIQVFAAGEIVPGLQALDATSISTVEMCHTYAGYYVGKDPTFAFLSGMPFGLSSRQQNAFMYHGPGADLTDQFLKKHSVVGIPGGGTGVQLAGWFRKEINSVTDLKGLKFRIGGLAGRALAKIGVVPQQISAAEIYPALERGAIDGVEWVGPYDDEKLGFHKVARFSYFPGWYDGGPMIHFFINDTKFQSLPAAYKAALRVAGHRANEWMLSKYDTVNPPALRRLIAAGTQFRPLPRDVLDASYAACEELNKEISSTNADYKAFLEAFTSFRSETALWLRIADTSLENYVFNRINQ